MVHHVSYKNMKIRKIQNSRKQVSSREKVVQPNGMNPFYIYMGMFYLFRNKKKDIYSYYDIFLKKETSSFCETRILGSLFSETTISEPLLASFFS